MPVLKVKINGVWQDVASNAAKVFVVEIDNGTMTANHSASEIKAAHDAGQCVMAHYLAYNYILALYAFDQACFTCSMDGGMDYTLIVKEDKSVTISTERPKIDEITAVPGQMAVVKTVDDDGHPTEWEAVDFVGGESAIVSMAIDKVDGEVTITYTMDDDAISKDILKLDDEGYPYSLNCNGVDIPISWSGFEVEEVTET